MTAPEASDWSHLEGDLRIGDFIVRPLLKLVRPLAGSEGTESKLPDKAMAVLLYLAENARQVCERDEILDAVWGEDREAYDRVLDNAIAEIRRALGDDARNPTYVQTIAKRGYRLKMAVEFLPGAFTIAEAVPTTRARTLASGHSAADARLATGVVARTRRRWRQAGVAILASAAALGAWFWSSLRPDELHVDVSVLAHPDVTVAGALAAVKRATFDHHPCGENSLLAPSSPFSPSALHVSLARDSRNDLRLSAEITGNSGNQRPGDETKAVSMYEQALAFNSTYPWAHCRLGLLLQQQGRLDEALVHFGKMQEVFGAEPEDPVGQQCVKAFRSLEP